jgi:hypothetical protein
LKRRTFFARELWLFIEENSLLFREIVFFTRELLLSPLGTCLGLALDLFLAWQNYFLKATNLKNYLHAQWIFSTILFVEKNNCEKN